MKHLGESVHAVTMREKRKKGIGIETVFFDKPAKNRLRYSNYA